MARRKKFILACISVICLWLTIPWQFVGAANRGDEATVRIYLKCGVNPDIPSYAGMTALKWAAYGGNTSMARLLLKHGADPHTAVGQAAGMGHADILAMLLDAGAELTGQQGEVILCAAAGSGNLATVNLVLKQGVDVNGRGVGVIDQGMTPIHCAARGGSLDVVRVLAEHGADMTAHSADGRTALMYAASSGTDQCDDICRYLIRHWVKVNVADNQGGTALMDAVYQDESDATLATLELMLQNGADINARDKYGETALSYAEDFEHPREAARLKKAGAQR